MIRRYAPRSPRRRNDRRQCRLRLGRHSGGLLQSLTGTALQLENTRCRVETDPQTVGRSLIDIQGLLPVKQRVLRTLIRQLEPDRPAAPLLAPPDRR